MGDVSELPKRRAPQIAAPCPITDRHDLSAFTCEHDALNDWLRSQARKSEGKTARTFVVTLAESQVVIGYYCLASGAERRDKMPKKIRQGLSDPTPLTIIGRLAVDKAFGGQGIGAGLVRDALRRALSASESVGSRAVMVHAIDEMAVAFWSHFGFVAFPSDARTMFLPIETIVAAL